MKNGVRDNLATSLASPKLSLTPFLMTVAVILAGLFPILLGHDGGSEVMQRIAAPMIGGMLTAPLLTMLALPAAFRLLVRHRLHKAGRTSPTSLPTEGN